MRPGFFDELELERAQVRPDATLRDAAATLVASGAGAVAVVAEDGRVAGVLTEDDLLRAIFPGYLQHLHHTAFLTDDDRLRPHLDRVAETSVSEHMRKPEVVELPSSAIDCAQRFLHSELRVIVAVRNGAFAGLISEAAFCRAVVDRYGWDV